ncbi:MAG: hypothetical protein C0467_27415 [Planctomycetaceae bacterium]|nr:hypothetical protein [Planctomycetaceae bacterium]
MVCWLGALLLTLFVASAVLRGGVALANRAIGTEKVETVIGWDWDSEEEDDLIPVESDKPAIPEPSFSKAIVIVFLAALVNTVIAFLLSVRLDGPLNLEEWPVQVAAYMVGAAGGFVVLLGILAAMLPTTPKRAALVTLFVYLIVVAMVTLVYGLIYLILK